MLLHLDDVKVPGGRYWEPEDDRTEEERRAEEEANLANWPEDMELPFM